MSMFSKTQSQILTRKQDQLFMGFTVWYLLINILRDSNCIGQETVIPPPHKLSKRILEVSTPGSCPVLFWGPGKQVKA